MASLEAGPQLALPRWWSAADSRLVLCLRLAQFEGLKVDSPFEAADTLQLPVVVSVLPLFSPCVRLKNSTAVLLMTVSKFRQFRIWGFQIRH